MEQFIRIGNDFHRAASIRSAELTTDHSPGFGREVERFTIYFENGETKVYVGDASSDESARRGLLAFNEFGRQVRGNAEGESTP